VFIEVIFQGPSLGIPRNLIPLGRVIQVIVDQLHEFGFIECGKLSVRTKHNQKEGNMKRADGEGMRWKPQKKKQLIF